MMNVINDEHLSEGPTDDKSTLVRKGLVTSDNKPFLEPMVMKS